jgi:hypothetical protein
VAVLKTVEPRGSVGSNPTSSAIKNTNGEVTELAEGARLLSECRGYTLPRVRISLSPPVKQKAAVITAAFAVLRA